jgi:hypothetical protein
MTMRVAAALAAGLLMAGAVPAPAQDASAERAETFAELPYWPGYWVSEFQAGTTIGGIAPASIAAREKGEGLPPNFMSLAGGGAPWNEAGRARLAEKFRIAQGRKAMGWGFPMMMNAATPLQFLVTPEEVLIINSYNEARHIYTDGRDHPPREDLWPTTLGHSVGHWEGDTLVVDTIMVKDPVDYFHGAPPLSDQAHYVERIRLEGDRLVSDVTIEDPVTLTEPWNVQLSWVRDEGFDRMVQIDWENDRTGFDGELNTIEPEAVEE